MKRHSRQEAKAWRCPGCGSALGVVVRNGSGVRNLLLYRVAVDTPSQPSHPLPDPPPEGGGEEAVDVMAVVEGYVADVRCSRCGRVRTWVPGEEAMRRLMETVRRQKGSA